MSRAKWDDVLVTGGAGFIGSHLVDHLLKTHHRVVVIDSLVTGRRENLVLHLDRSQFRLIEMDLAPWPENRTCKTGEHWADLIEERMPGFWPKRVYHLACIASPKDYQTLPIQTLMAGSEGTLQALEIARRYDARFLLTSTSEVYGDPAVHPQVESYWGNVNPCGPRSMYDEAKRYSEALVAAYQSMAMVDCRVARIFNTYGPRMRADDGRAIPNFISQALRKEKLTVYGGDQTRSLCYVSDMVDGLVALMESDHDGPCNLGNPQEITMQALAETVNKHARNDAGTTTLPLPQDDPTRRCPDTTLARERLGWEPKVSLEQGLRWTVKWFRRDAKDALVSRWR